jgi:hypothetical protein
VCRTSDYLSAVVRRQILSKTDAYMLTTWIVMVNRDNILYAQIPTASSTLLIATQPVNTNLTRSIGGRRSLAPSTHGRS